MADAPTPEEQPSKKFGKKSIIMMAVLLIGEAVLIVGGMMVLAGPADVAADNLEAVTIPEEEMIVELQIVDTRFPNSKRGVTYLYQSEVYVQVKRRHNDQVTAELEQYRNEIKSELAAVWRLSDPHHFDEPKLENLTRKVYALMDTRFGTDAETGESIVVKVVIVMGTGLRVDG